MLRPATAADFGFIHDLARRPDYAPFINDDPDQVLEAYLEDPCTRLLVWEEAGAPAGFALFCTVGDLSGAVELRRLALAETGRGRGRAFLRTLTDFGFRQLRAERVWLDASSENPRAVATYQKAGFKLEGKLRQHWYRPALGRAVDLILFGMLRAEWEALEPLPVRA